MTSSPIRKFAVARPAGTSEDLPAVFHGSAIKAALHQTIHKANKSVGQLAFECRISPSYLYRACLSGESGCRFPIELAAPLMRAAGDYRALGVLAGECDRTVVALPRVATMKRAGTPAVNEVSMRFAEAMAEAMQFFAAPTRGGAAELVQSLRWHVAEIAALAKAVAEYEQGDLL